MSDAEPRRSVRSTKGQHKSLDQLDQSTTPTATEALAASTGPATSAITTKKYQRGGRRAGSKKLGNDDRSGSAGAGDETEEEIIRCVCGATEQDGDPGEPWIACDSCGAWQHNVCMGMSVYSEDLAKDYFCERCKPENHAQLLEGIARGEKPWEERRRLYEEEKANEKKRKGGRKAKGKRNSDAKETSARPSPTPEARREVRGPAGTKRKTRADSEDQDGKKRKLSEDLPLYNPPADIPGRISELPDTRQTPAKGLGRALSEVLNSLQKKGDFVPTEDVSVESTAERLAIQIERAVYDAHANHKEYGAQIRTLRFNLKENHELCTRLLQGSLIPPMLASMTSDELASRELQQKTAKMRAQAERQSILDTDDTGAPRLRRTHKGEELVERGGASVTSTEDKPSVLRRQSMRDGGDNTSESAALRRSSDARRGTGLRVDTKPDAVFGKKDFDLKRVFSSVRSPTSPPGHKRRLSQPQLPADGPGEDPDVDRLLEDDIDESPPYSPTEETDPDVVWRGILSMNTVANFQATARHVGGVNLSTTIGLPWMTLVPKKLTVAGRIDEQMATEYLCSLRYSPPTDISVASLGPATEAAKADFLALIDYFTQRHRYGVVAEKGVDNVRDTYLVPIPAGTSSHPEFMLNLEDNFIPTSRAAPMLLLVIVYRNDPAAMEKLRGPNWAGLQMTPSASAKMPAASVAAAAPAASLESTPISPTPIPLNIGRCGPISGSDTTGDHSQTASIPAPASSPAVPQVPATALATVVPQTKPNPTTPPLMPAEASVTKPLAAAQKYQAAPPPQHQPPQHVRISQQPPLASRPTAQAPAVQPLPPHLLHQPLQPQPPQQHQPYQVPPHATAVPAAPPQLPTAAAHHHPTPIHLTPVPPPPVPGTPTTQQQLAGEAIAREILGPLASCSAAGFLMTQAAKMQRNEWLLVRSVFEQQPQTRNDLQLLKHELERYNDQPARISRTPQPVQAQVPAPHPPVHAHGAHAPNPSAVPPAKPPQMQTPVPIPRVPHSTPQASSASRPPAPPTGSTSTTQPGGI